MTLTLGALSFVAAGCGGGTDLGAPDPTNPSTPGRSTTTAPPQPGGELERCESPLGFAISAPASWATNNGTVVAACSMFNPEPFQVPEATDQRVAAITAYTGNVSFATASKPGQGRDEDRAVTTIGGRQAVRLSYEYTGEGLYPAGTPVTFYAVDLAGGDAGAETLFLNTVGTPNFDYERNVTVLDRMFQTLELTADAVETDPSVVASYLGGGGGFSVIASTSGQDVCLAIPPAGREVCTDRPAADQVHTVALRDHNRDAQAGVTGTDVWRVDLVTPAGETHSYLPAPVPGTGLGAYAFPDTIEGFAKLVLSDMTGDRIRAVEPGGA